MPSFTIYLPEDLYRKLLNRDRSKVIQEALRRYLEEEEKLGLIPRR